MERNVASVIGGSGFLGRYVVKRLAAAYYVVRVVCRHREEAKFLQPMGDVGQIVPVRGDITREADTHAAVEGAAVVINLVGTFRASLFRAVHVEGAARVARLAREGGTKRLVHVSALGADAASPSAYGRSKKAGEDAVLAAFPEATIVRPSVIFGPEDQFFNRFAAMSKYLPFLPVMGRDPAGGGTRFQPVYVGDVADAIMAILARPDTRGKIYEFGGPRVYSFRELMALTLEEVERRRALVPIPAAIARLQAAFAQYLPGAPLTPDQVRMLERDNVVSPGALGFNELGIEPTGAEAIVHEYLDRFRARRRRRVVT